MKWIKLLLFISVFVLGVYSASMFFVEKFQSFKVEKVVDFPLDKVYAQFINPQNLSEWNVFTDNNDQLSYTYFSPYEGLGSSLKYINRKDSTERGDLFIRYVKPNQGIKYQLFKDKERKPYLIDVAFKALSDKQTQITWQVRTPSREFLERSLNLLYEENFNTRVEKSMANLHSVLMNKVDKEERLNALKFDTLMFERQSKQLLIGLNTSGNNKKGGDLYHSVSQDYHKLHAYLTKDLMKKEDEFGEIQVLYKVANLKNKELPYFIGSEVSKEQRLSDPNFSFREVKESYKIIAYYRGAYDARKSLIYKMIKEAETQKYTIGEISEMFLKPLDESGEVTLKISLEIYR